MRLLSAKECRPFFDAVEEKATQMGAPVATAIVGPEGHVIAVERMVGAGFITADTAIAKAYTIAAFRTMSPRFPDGLVIQKWFQQRNPQFLINAAALTGGRVAASGGMAPIFDGDDIIGAYGISGATSDQDEIMGRHAREKVGWRHEPESDIIPQETLDHIREVYETIGLSDRLG
ncbi:heme-binding protein [Rhodovulum iodosum]|nr:heme-binding protein [Rhodovulum robiginosum]